MPFVKKIARLLSRQDLTVQCWFLESKDISLLIHTISRPIAIHITTANITFREGAYVILKVPESSRLKVVNVLADGGITLGNFCEFC
jgi:hypothetical protein